MAKSFDDLYKHREKTPGYHAERMAMAFLAELNSQMQSCGISNSDLARAASVSPAYITKLFRGPSNVSLETIAKLALAVGCRPHLHLAVEGAQVRWFDVMQRREQVVAKESITTDFGEMMKVLDQIDFKSPQWAERLPNADASNDQQFLDSIEFA